MSPLRIEREKYLRDNCHLPGGLHMMETEHCWACDLGELFAEIDYLRDAMLDAGFVIKNQDIVIKNLISNAAFALEAANKEKEDRSHGEWK